METGTRSAQGDSAAWYLELVGLKEPEAAPSAAPLDPRRAEGEATSSAAPAQDTAPMAAQTAVAVAEADPLAGWTPADLSRPMSRRRRFRISVVAAVAAVTGLVVAAVALLPLLVERQATNEVSTYRATMSELRAELPTTQSILATVTERDTDPLTLPSLVPDLAQLDGAADEVRLLGTNPLPDSLPGLPTGPLDELEPTRETMRRLGAEGIAVSDRIGAAIAYRTLLPELLVTPALPTEATSQEIQDLSAELATTLADTSGLLRELPDDPAFAAHRESVRAAVDRFAEWQLEYLAALRNGDAALASTLIDEVTTLQDGLVGDIVAPLRTLRREVDQAIVTLDKDLAAALAALPR